MIVTTPHTGAYLQAQAMEQLEVALHGAYVQVRLAQGLPAAEQSLAGGIMAFTGVSSPLTQAVGMGVQLAEYTAAEIAGYVQQLQQFFLSRGASPAIELNHLASPLWAAALARAGFVPEEYSSVLLLELCDGIPPLPVLPPGYAIEPLPGAEPCRTPALAAILTGFGLPVTPDNLGFQYLWYTSPGSAQWMATYEGEPVAGANCFRQGAYSLLSGASTVPAHRGKGLQKALVAARLHHLQAQGVERVAVVTGPGTVSEQNMLKLGFRMVYGRTRWVLSATA
ncbi:MAG: GNAT family N-acetyltransferase [Bacteroidetes bacterium]|nr:GNAT family N-acetyltransferase [Bacteroidota bacterium]